MLTGGQTGADLSEQLYDLILPALRSDCVHGNHPCTPCHFSHPLKSCCGGFCNSVLVPPQRWKNCVGRSIFLHFIGARQRARFGAGLAGEFVPVHDSTRSGAFAFRLSTQVSCVERGLGHLFIFHPPHLPNLPGCPDPVLGPVLPDQCGNSH